MSGRTLTGELANTANTAAPATTPVSNSTGAIQRRSLASRTTEPAAQAKPTAPTIAATLSHTRSTDLKPRNSGPSHGAMTAITNPAASVSPNVQTRRRALNGPLHAAAPLSTPMSIATPANGSSTCANGASSASHTTGRAHPVSQDASAPNNTPAAKTTRLAICSAVARPTPAGSNRAALTFTALFSLLGAGCQTRDTRLQPPITGRS